MKTRVKKCKSRQRVKIHEFMMKNMKMKDEVCFLKNMKNEMNMEVKFQKNMKK